MKRILAPCHLPRMSDGIVELSWLDRRQETRLEKVVDKSLTGGRDAGLLGFGECDVRLERLAHGSRVEVCI